MYKQQQESAIMMKYMLVCILLYTIDLDLVLSEFHWTEQKSRHPHKCNSDLKNVFTCCCEPYDVAEMSNKPSIIYLKESGKPLWQSVGA